ncbi:MAG: ATP synthase F1 subunit gamma [Planctomycetota bacterium]|nr:MAG: ATP synthase F1 subunit gamma [Planctomycetota bacterium]
MANTRQILQRRNAAANISKVTSTMETISAVRYRQYYNQWAEGLAFYDSLAQLAYLMVTAQARIEHPLLGEQKTKSKTNALIVIGSDRGLCGAYNSEVFRQIDTHVRMANRFGRTLKIYAKGKKVLSYLDHLKIRPDQVYEDFSEVPSVEQANAIGDFFMDEYLAGKIDRLGIVYNRFFSPASQKAQTLTVLPVVDMIDDLTTRATVIWPWELDFEDFEMSPSPEHIFETLAKMIIRTSVLGCFLEASVSEHLSRVVCMRSASDNAEEMIKDLTKDYNRARQGQITVELLDIVGGVEAAKG